VDLRPIAVPPSAEERAVIDALLGPRGAERTVSVREAAGLRHLLLPALHALQDRFGWLPPGGLGYACERLHVPPAEAFGVATFYALFSLVEVPPVVLHVCDDLACRAAGTEGLVAELERTHGPAGEARAGCTWHRSPCLGQCERAPAALLVAAGERPRRRTLVRSDARAMAAALERADAPAVGPNLLPQLATSDARFPLRLLARAGRVDPTSLEAYVASGGTRALALALERGPAHVLEAVTAAGLVGRGGAAFPTGRKWQAVANAKERTRYLVCNADESEPGTFKDRVVLEEDPFALIEAMVIAGTTIGAERGFVYLRGEYPLVEERLTHALARARAAGWLGERVLGRGPRFELELRRGAGAYICGEETALFNSLEGFRGEPRSKPPFPVEVGLFGRPTVVNNVETLLNVLPILNEGVERYRSVGTAGSPGTRLFCVSGKVARPGLYELPFGVRLSELLTLAGAEDVHAVLLGGAAGSFVTASELELPLTFEDTRKAGTTLGSGVVLVLDRSVALEDLVGRIARFFRDESCGQCVPCRIGTVRQEELVQRLCRSKPLGDAASERVRLAELGQVMRDASICGLGQTASAAIESAVAKFGLFGAGKGGR
jgi:NADH-quinone oxidoreductase subunit F